MYRFATKKENFEDYSSGRVLYGMIGATSFPVRLSSEIFQRCKEYLEQNNCLGPYTIYDPLAGSAYALTVLGLLHRSDVKKLIASDVDDQILSLAQKNLSLLTIEGISHRQSELENLYNNFGKESHKQALESAVKFRNLIAESSSIDIACFNFNILATAELPNEVNNIDMLITDVPYGSVTGWTSSNPELNSVQTVLSHVRNRLRDTAIISISSDKKQEIKYDGYKLIKKFSIGKRRILLLSPE